VFEHDRPPRDATQCALRDRRIVSHLISAGSHLEVDARRRSALAHDKRQMRLRRRGTDGLSTHRWRNMDSDCGSHLRPKRQSRVEFIPGYRWQPSRRRDQLPRRRASLSRCWVVRRRRGRSRRVRRQSERVWRVGVLMGYLDNDLEAQAWVAVFHQRRTEPVHEADGRRHVASRHSSTLMKRDLEQAQERLATANDLAPTSGPPMGEDTVNHQFSQKSAG